MANYSKYTYHRLLEYLDKEYTRDTDRKNYASYLLSINNADSLSDIFTIYNRIFYKLANYYYSGDLPENDWFFYDYWVQAVHENCCFNSIEELNDCLNENILRVFKSGDTSSLDFYYSCLVNLRQAKNLPSIQNQLISLVPEDNTDKGKELIYKRDKSYEVRTELANSVPYSNGFYDAKDRYISLMKDLFANGYVETSRESLFESKANILYIKSVKDLKIKIISFLIVLIIMVGLLKLCNG